MVSEREGGERMIVGNPEIEVANQMARLRWMTSMLLGPAMAMIRTMPMIVGLVVDSTGMREVGMMRDASLATGVDQDTNNLLQCLAGVAGEATFMVEMALVGGGVALQLAGVGEGGEEGLEVVMRATGVTSKGTETDHTVFMGIGVTALVQEQ